MRKIRFLLGTLVLVMAFMVMVVPIEARSLAVALDLTDVDVCNFNMGAVGNFAFTRANSGWNRTHGDSGTGNATATAGVGTNLNSSLTDVTIYDFEWGPMAINMGEGEGDLVDECCHRPRRCWPRRLRCYDSVAIALDLTKVEVSNFNAGRVGNIVFTWANTGRNMTRGGSSDTGDAIASASVRTTLNSSSTSISIVEGGLGPVAVNYEPAMPFFPGHRPGGPGGRSLALAVEADVVEVSNINLGMVTNVVATGANTGHNMTGGGDSDTGNATASSAVANTVNSNTTDVSIADGSVGPVAVNAEASLPPVDGCLDGGCGPGPIVGPAGGPVAANIGEEGIAVAVDVDKVEVSNVNVASVNNDVVTSANTGDNTTCGEEAVSDTGNASASTTVSNTVNTNDTTVVIGNGAP